jgi:hypothetical protein
LVSDEGAILQNQPLRSQSLVHDSRTAPHTSGIERVDVPDPGIGDAAIEPEAFAATHLINQFIPARSGSASVRFSKLFSLPSINPSGWTH